MPGGKILRPVILKEPPPLPCPTRSFGHMLPYVGLARRLTTFGRNADVSATVCGSSRVRFNYGPRTVVNHEQGRENFRFNKERLHLINRPVRQFSQELFSKIFFGDGGKFLLWLPGGVLLKISRAGLQVFRSSGFSVFRFFYPTNCG